jgi:propanol-preferring alcohol dehydrogenase
VVGSAVGTEDELQELLRMAAAGRVSAHYEVFDFDQANEVMEKLVRYEVEGRVVLIPQSGASPTPN